MTEHGQNGWMVLFKFGKREHLEQLRNDGLLYMNTQSYFANLEADEARADRFEGTSRIVQPTSIKELTITGPASICENKIKLGKISIAPSDMAGPVSISLDKFSCNVYCMYALTKPASGPVVDKRVSQFGDSFVLVLNTQEFLDRLCSAAKAANFSYEYRLVEYYDPDAHSGETGPFRKPATFSYQNEFRLIIRPASPGAIQLTAGSCFDITSDVHPLSEIERLVDFGVESAQQVGLSW